jgi:hypothetical protein
MPVSRSQNLNFSQDVLVPIARSQNLNFSQDVSADPAPSLILAPDTYTTAFSASVNMDVLANDTNVPGGATLTITDPPNHGTASINGDGVTVDYTPSGLFVGDDVLKYDIDNSGSPAQVTVTITGSLSLSGNLVESLAITSWDVHAFSLDGAEHLKTTSTGTTYSFPSVNNHAYVIVGYPTIDFIWESSKVVATGDYITSRTVSGVWQAANAGTTGSTEPAFTTSGATSDNGVTWNYIDDLPEPQAQGPIMPTLT